LGRALLKPYVRVGADSRCGAEPRLRRPRYSTAHRTSARRFGSVLAPHRASAFKVTNGEFLRFVKAGGYANPKYWSAEGWGWKTFRNVKWPTFWMPDGPQGLHR
jgi:hypothetical protein